MIGINLQYGQTDGLLPHAAHMYCACIGHLLLVCCVTCLLDQHCVIAMSCDMQHHLLQCSTGQTETELHTALCDKYKVRQHHHCILDASKITLVLKCMLRHFAVQHSQVVEDSSLLDTS